MSSCPFPITDYPIITIAHGGGGRLSAQLIDQMFLPLFGSKLSGSHDSTEFNSPGSRLAMTTDSYVVKPLFFPGGNIGQMAVIGTANDLAMSGARAQYLSCAFILEEGLPTVDLLRVVTAMSETARALEIQIITGDTKVVERGHGDQIFINTCGVGPVLSSNPIGPQSIRPGDQIILSGDVGRHGVAILSARAGLQFKTTLESDCAPLFPQVQKLMNASISIHCLRDLTRGGLATALAELVQSSGYSMEFSEAAVPVHEAVQGACELLGLDPFFCANEGRMIAFVPKEEAPLVLKELPHAHLIGSVQESPASTENSRPQLLLRTRMGTLRRVERLSGEQLPRIC